MYSNFNISLVLSFELDFNNTIYRMTLICANILPFKFNTLYSRP